MVVRGHIQNGQVVIPGGLDWPEGTPVDILPLHRKAASRTPNKSRRKPSKAKKAKRAGRAKKSLHEPLH
ncbi:hypothetical protein PHYC_00495 [Phycisphaerales bacterium]|nr:hypothetical protein PHYC_00495 [Phycisphaerales bacterium]